MQPRASSPPSAAAAPAPIVALSEDQALLQSLAQAGLEQPALVSAPSLDRFLDQLSANDAEVALIDATIAPNPLEGFLTGLRARFPRLQVVLIGAAHLQAELAARIADGTVFRFAHRPASAQRLKLLLTTALHAPRPDASATARAAAPAAEPPADTAAAARPAGRAGAWLWPLLLTLVALAALTLGWYVSGHPRAAAAPP